MPDNSLTTDLTSAKDTQPKPVEVAEPPALIEAPLTAHPALAAMLVAARTPQDFRPAIKAIEARIEAENEAELQAESLTIQRVVSQVGPYIINRNKEKTNVW